MFDKLESIEKRCLELEGELAQPEIFANREVYIKKSKEYADLEEIVVPYQRYMKLKADYDANALELDATDDAELREMLKEENERLLHELDKLEAELTALLMPTDPNDKKDVIIEIRAGAGGDEASLFAAELMRMYQRYAEIKGWRFAVLDTNEIGLGGVKEVTCEITGRNVYRFLRFESGVHRVQRVPVTESSGRIHTSTVTVAVLPAAEDVDIALNEKDLKIDVYRSSGAGGQHVNKTSSAIRITHLPTGLVVTCQDERSQLQNKEKAYRILRSHLYQAEQERLWRERAADRKGQVGTGERSEKIRTYNFPQNRVTDHRIGLTQHNLQQILAGEGLDDFVVPLQQDYQTRMLAGAGV
jgi:peptide chain release factor 1